MYKTLDTLRLTLLHIGFVRLDRNWRFDNVISPFSRLYLITGGEAWVFHNNKKYELKPNKLYLVPSFTHSKYQCEDWMDQYYISFLDQMDGGVGVYDLINFDFETDASEIDYQLMKRLLALNPNRTILKSDPRTYDNKPELLSYNQRYAQSYDKYLETHGILLQLFSRFFRMEKLSNDKKLKSYRRLASVIHSINEDLSKRITVEELAASVHLHPDYFSRLFLDILGVRPLDFINNKRMERAQFLLATTGMTISEIAVQVGIPNFSYFSRLFKRKFKVTPAAYRKRRWHI